MRPRICILTGALGSSDTSGRCTSASQTISAEQAILFLYPHLLLTNTQSPSSGDTQHMAQIGLLKLVLLQSLKVVTMIICFKGF